MLQWAVYDILTIRASYRNNYSSRLEEDPFPSGGGPTADYAFMLFFGAVVLWVRAFDV